jgi:uncharacterized membrane protein YGL010W
MKKAIFFNILITLAWFPYSMQRWLQMPAIEGTWSLEISIIFAAFFIAAGLAISNLLLLFSFRSTKFKRIFTKLTMLHLAGLFVYPIYSGMVVSWVGKAIWVDVLVIVILYGNLWLMNRAYQEMLVSK